MRICVVSPNFPPMSWPCGAADFVRRFAFELAQAGNAVTVLTSNPDANTEVEGVKVEIQPGNWGPAYVARTSRWLRAANFDVIDVQYEAAMYGYTPYCLFLPLLLRGGGALRALTLHSQDLPARGGRLWRPLQFLPYDKVFFYSQSFHDRVLRRFPTRDKDFFLRGFPTNIVKADATNLDSLLARMKTGTLERRPIVVYFGHIGAGRGLEDVLETLHSLNRDGVDSQFVLMSKFDPVENDYHRQLIAWARHRGMGDRLTFTGRVENDVVSLVLQAADVCVLPFPEGASLKNGSMAAAIDHGVPVVTTVTELTESVLLESGALRTYTPGDRAALQAILRTLLSDLSQTEQIRTKMQSMRDLYSWKKYIEARIEAYR